MGMFKRGYEAARDEVKRQEENREKMGKRLWRFFLSKDNDEAAVRFLTEEPINFNEHTIKVVRNGKESYDNHVCIGDDCPYCADGDRPSFKGAFLIYDRRPYEYTDKNGKKQRSEGQLRLYVAGTRVLSQLDRLSSRYGLTTRDYFITRSGSGTSTTYMFDRCDESGKLTEAEIKNMLPESIRDMFDGTQESLYRIVESQLELLVDGSNDDSDDRSDTDDGDIRSRRNLVGVDDDEPEEAPARSSRPSVPNRKKLGFKPKENSVKSMLSRNR